MPGVSSQSRLPEDLVWIRWGSGSTVRSTAAVAQDPFLGLCLAGELGPSWIVLCCAMLDGVWAGTVWSVWSLWCAGSAEDDAVE